AAPLKKGDHVFLVDGSGYIFRAYHALPPINRKSDGLQLNAVFGFCNMLWKLLRDMKAEDKPTHLAVVFDLSEKTFRTEMYPDYKAHRPDPPDDLKPQFGVLPDKVIEVQALIGDSTDNVPGVAGVGPKAAAVLISELGSLDEIFKLK